MGVDFAIVARTCEGRSFPVAELEATHSDLCQRIAPHCDLPTKGDWGDPTRIRTLAYALRQVLLHRAICLFEGTLDALVADNPYMMTLGMRAAFETTAALGYLHQRLSSFTAGNIDAAQIDQDIASQILGSRHSSIPNAMPAKQVLMMLEYADRSVSKEIMGGSTREHAILRDSYDFLCEFAHPNFHSNKMSYDLDKQEGRLIIRHGKSMLDEHFRTLSYLLLAAPLQVQLHDAIEDVLPDVPE